MSNETYSNPIRASEGTVDILQRNENTIKWLGIAAIVGIVLLAIYVIVDSMPPRRFTILTGREGGGYYRAAEEYQKIAAEKGFTLDIRPTSGSVEALKLLEAGEAGIGFIQGGIAADADPAVLSTLASVFYEPVWVFYNKSLATDETLEHLHQLEGLRVGVGEAGSGANRLIMQLLGENSLTPDNTTLVEMPSWDAAAALQDGSLDAALFVVAPSSQIVQDLIRDPNLELMSVARADAYRAKFPFLTSVVLPEGAFDVRAGIPNEDKTLIATVANLTVRNDFHPDLVRLMTIAAVETHEDGGLFEQRYEFPNFDHADLPVGKEELAYMERIKSGESTLDNYLPFWAAALIDRYLLFVVPVAILFLPLLSRTTWAVEWYNKRKITRWYRQVRGMDRSVPNMDMAEIDRSLETLDAIEQQLQETVNVPVDYMSEYYDLRGNIDLVQDRLEKRRARLLQGRNGSGE